MTAGTKILLIGIDAGDSQLIQQWAQEGALPTFRRLIASGSWGTTANPPGLESGAVWATFYTGVSPARHGQYNGNMHFDPTRYREEEFKVGELTSPPVWAILSGAGRRVAVIDAPYTYLDPRINGINVVDWGTHARRAGATLQTWPPPLAAEIVELFGPDEIGECDAIRPRNVDEYEAFRDKLVGRVESKTDLALHYLAEGNWDLFAVIYGDAHCVGHQCWHVHESGHHMHDPVIASVVGDPVKDVYVALDAAIGRLLEGCGSDTTAVVYCSHGMTNRYSGTRLLDDMLQALEGVRRPEKRNALADVVRRLWVRAPRWLRTGLLPLRGPVYAALLENKREGRRFFEVLNNDATGGVRINLQGREKEGLVEPGAEYDALCASLTRDLQSFVNADSGEPLITEVIKTADVYSGDRLAILPDLLVRWNRSAPIFRVSSPLVGTIENRHAEGRSGDHTLEGLFFVPGGPPQAIDRKVPVEDFAPTLLELLDVAAPGLDGQPIAEILQPSARFA